MNVHSLNDSSVDNVTTSSSPPERKEEEFVTHHCMMITYISDTQCMYICKCISFMDQYV